MTNSAKKLVNIFIRTTSPIHLSPEETGSDDDQFREELSRAALSFDPARVSEELEKKRKWPFFPVISEFIEDDFFYGRHSRRTIFWDQI